MNNMTIAQLRRNGYKVRVHHIRPKIKIQKIGGVSEENNPKGGHTMIEITTPEGKSAVAYSICSKHDSWNRKLGNQIALGRALSQLAV